MPEVLYSVDTDYLWFGECKPPQMALSFITTVEHPSSLHKRLLTTSYTALLDNFGADRAVAYFNFK